MWMEKMRRWLGQISCYFSDETLSFFFQNCIIFASRHSTATQRSWIAKRNIITSRCHYAYWKHNGITYLTLLHRKLLMLLLNYVLRGYYFLKRCHHPVSIHQKIFDWDVVPLDVGCMKSLAHSKRYFFFKMKKKCIIVQEQKKYSWSFRIHSKINPSRIHVEVVLYLRAVDQFFVI